MSLFQASQHTVTISSYDLKTRLDSQLSRMNRQMLSMGFSSGALGRVPRGARVILYFWPARASSCHQSSISVVAGRAARIASSAAGTSF